MRSSPKGCQPQHNFVVDMPFFAKTLDIDHHWSAKSLKSGIFGSGGRQLGVEVARGGEKNLKVFQRFTSVRRRVRICGVCLVGCDCVPRMKPDRRLGNSHCRRLQGDLSLAQ